MRLLHTSDWHLGRAFHGESLIAEQRAVVDVITALVEERSIDLVVIAGDLYDRAIPPTAAVELFDDALAALRRSGATVVAIAGNHDSAPRVSVHDRVLEAAGVSIRGDVSRLLDPLVLPADDGGPPVAVYPVPFLEPTAVAPTLARLAEDAGMVAPAEGADDGSGEGRRRPSHQDVMRTAMDLVRSHAASSDPTRTVVVAHTFVAGGDPSDSERDLTIGNVELVHTDTFDGIDYVALGHLHGRQDWDGGRIAYSGTPLPYSFSEESHTKSVRVVDLDPTGAVSVEDIPLGVGRPLRTLRGPLGALLTDVAHADAEVARVRAVLTDTELPLHAMARLRERFPGAVALVHEPEGRVAPRLDTVRDRLAEGRDQLGLARSFWADIHGAEADSAQTAVLTAALTAAGWEGA